eukprot:IDg16439t1
MAMARLLPSSAPLMFTNLSAGDLLQILSYLNRQGEWLDEEDLLAAESRKFKELRPPAKEKVRKEDISSVDDIDSNYVSDEYREELRAILMNRC